MQRNIESPVATRGNPTRTWLVRILRATVSRRQHRWRLLADAFGRGR